MMAHNASLRSACAVLLVLLAAAGAAAAREFGPKAAATNGGGAAAVVLEVFEDSLPDTGNTGRRQLTGSRHPPLRAIIPPPGKNVPRVRRAPPPHRHPPAGSGGLKRPPPAASGGGDTRERIDLVVFGDSLSDTGNTFRAAGVPQADLYYQGRYSNGPIWVDYLAAAVANTTQLTVLNYAHGGAAACPENSVATQIRFIRDLPAQTSAFLANISAPQQQSQQGGGGRRRLLPINFIGNNDVRNVLSAGISGGVYPTEQSIGALALAITSCRLAWAKQLLGAGEAVWGQQRGPERVLVLLPLARLDLTPSVPKELKPTLKAVTDAINNVLTAAVAALNAELAAAPVDSGSRGARLLVLPDFTGVVAATVTPPFTNFDEACFFHPAYVLDVVPGIVPCTDPDTHVFYDQLHPTTRLQKAFALRGVLPALQQAGLLPAAA